MMIDANARPRQLLIGLDGAEWSLLERWAAEGRLPNIRNCIESGTRALLSTPAGHFSDAAWTAIHASATPAQTRKYFDLQYQPNLQEVQPADDDTIDNQPFWEKLDRAGLSVGVLDAPKFPLSRQLEGFQVGNWGACSTHTIRASTPPELLGRIDAEFSAHPVSSCHSFEHSPTGHRELFDALLEGIHRRGEIARWLMQSNPSDIFFTTFSETHCAGHYLWRYMDPEHHLHATGDPHGLKDAVLNIYEAVDREMGALFELAGPDAIRLVFSACGMGPLRHVSWSMGQIIELMGFGEEEAPELQTHHSDTNLVQRVKKRMPISLQLRIKGILPESLQERIHKFGYTGKRDWKRARAFAVPNNIATGAVRVNLKGRDRFGRVEPGAAYRALCREIAGALLELRDADSGRAVAREVTITQEEFAGPHLDGLPDLTVSWDQSFEWTRLESPRFGTLEVAPPSDPSGTHTPHGFLVANGPGIPADRVLQGHSTYDIGPTVLALAALAPCDEFEGRAMEIDVE